MEGVIMEKEKLIKIAIFTQKKTRKDGGSYTKYSTKYAFRMENGRVSKYIDIAFTEDAFTDSPVKKNDIKRGYLYVDPKFVGCPDKYEVTEENGKKKYPKCYIRGGIAKYEEVLKEHTFYFDTDIDNEETSEELEETEDAE